MAINFGDILGGLGAAYGGRAQEYAQGIQQREQGLTERKRAELEARQRAMYQDGYQAFQMLSDGNIDGIISLANDRLEMLATFPDADPSDTLGVIRDAEAAKAGDPMALRNLSMTLSSAAQTAQRMGLVPQRQEQSSETNALGQRVYTTGPNAGQVVPGFEATTVEKTPESIRVLEARAAQLYEPGSDEFKNFIARGGPAAELGFEIVPVTEVSGIPGLDPAKTYQRNIRTGQIAQIGGGGTTVNVGNATEGERKAGTLANRLDFAMAQINDVIALNPEAQMPGKAATLLDAMGMDYLVRLANDADRQIVDAAQIDMLDAALTLATGAAYTKEQFEGYKKSYFPQLGDKPEVVAAKKQRLQNTIEAAYAAAGRAAPENMFSSEINANDPAIPTGVPAGSVFIGNAREDGKRVFRAPDGTNYKED